MPEPCPHFFYPVPWHTVRAPLAEEGHYLLFKEGVEVATFNLVLGFVIFVNLSMAQGPTEVRMIPLIPPAVQRAQVK